MDLSVEEFQRSETVGEHLTFDDETSGDVRGPPTSLTSLFTLAAPLAQLVRFYVTIARPDQRGFYSG